MNFLTAYLVGAITAIASSLPVGPLSMTVVQVALNQGKRSAYLLALGGMIIEVLFCAIALFSVSLIPGGEDKLQGDDGFLHDLVPITIIILLIIGIVSIVNRNKVPNLGRQKKAHGPLLLGVSLCIFNPMLLGFWFTITTVLKARGYLGATTLDSLFFIAGVTTGILIFFYSIISVASKSHRNIGPLWRRRINVGFGLFFIGFAIYLAIRLFFFED